MQIDLPTILIYHDPDSKTILGEYPTKLRQTLGAIQIAHADRHSLAYAIKSFRPSIIILPEIKGEESFYSRHIPETTQNMLMDFVKSGGMVTTLCAATYWMGQKVVYHPPKGTTKIRNGSHVFNAAAMKMFGPVPGLWRPSDGKAGMGGCQEIDILVKTENGLERDKVWYGNGPCIVPLGNAPLPDNLEPLAYYDGIEDNPVAAAALHIGKGCFLMSGPLMHYSGGSVKPNNMLWRVCSYRMHQQLFAKQPPSMVSVPS